MIVYLVWAQKGPKKKERGTHFLIVFKIHFLVIVFVVVVVVFIFEVIKKASKQSEDIMGGEWMGGGCRIFIYIVTIHIFRLNKLSLFFLNGIFGRREAWIKCKILASKKCGPTKYIYTILYYTLSFSFVALINCVIQNKNKNNY